MMKGGLGGLMKQAQQMQANMKKAQDELATVEVEGRAGSGLVKVTMTCSHEVRRVKLDDSLLSDDKEMLEDLIVSALNDAVKQVAVTTKARMSGFGAGLNLPPGMSLPF
jgi:nucleoid-associated protein EbfC